MKYLTNPAQLEEASARLRELLASRGGWRCAESSEKVSKRARAGRDASVAGVVGANEPVTLRAGEWDVSAAGGALHFLFADGAGWRAWRVAGWEWADGKLTLSVSRRAGAERATLELVPRASVKDAARALRDARLAECKRLASIACASLEGAGVESVRLSAGARRGEPGRYARIVLRRRGARGACVAVTGAVVPVKAHETDALLASALGWWTRLDARGPTRARRPTLRGAARSKRDPAGATELWLVAPPDSAASLAARLPLLREGVRRSIKLFMTETVAEAAETVTEATDTVAEAGATRPTTPPTACEMLTPTACETLTPTACETLTPTGRETLTPVDVLPLAALLTAAAGRRPRAPAALSETAARLSALAPAEIDVVRARHGETLRFCGLPFARVRRLLGRECVWFGPPGAGQKVLLGEENWPQLAKLIDELAAHRRAGAIDARHALYRAAPEAWLESILRRDITRLDPGLVVSPLHAQFRPSRERGGGARPVDLLALRRDGRLVVIELKVSESAALPLQGADYWRRVETRRRNGDLAGARLFGDLEIEDRPPLVYLVAPVFRFSRSFPTLARMVLPEIETYRFDINEDWRAGVRVVRRGRVN